MHKYPVALVAYEEFDNLGIRYIASVLCGKGFDPSIIDFRKGNVEILKTIKKLKPLVVGFSVIFQYHIYEFKELIEFLRNSGITSHFSAGGQYASMKYEDLFGLIPSIDTIVRFEGEYTFLELVTHVHSGINWKNIKGIAYKENGRIIANLLRPPETNLDRLPYPMRYNFEEYAFGKKFANLIASRGCVNNCSFCNNTEYLKQSSLPFKRVRKPQKVVEEIEFLHNQKDCTVFLFDDDDFPIKTTTGSDWVEGFCRELKRKKLVDKIMWKINCRSDQVDYDTFAMMKDCGLFLVFLGIDDGTDSGLARINKHMTVAKSMKGVGNLKKLGINFDYGFMLFQPTSTFKSVNENLDFLKDLCGDGYAPVKFLKMMPYFETRIEKDLMNEGRLKGKPAFWNYDFLNPNLNDYYEFIGDSFIEWMAGDDGIANISVWAGNYISVFTHFYNVTSSVNLLFTKIRSNIAKSNHFFIETMKDLSTIFESGKHEKGNLGDLKLVKSKINEEHSKYKELLLESIRKVFRNAEYQTLDHIINNSIIKF